VLCHSYCLTGTACRHLTGGLLKSLDSNGIGKKVVDIAFHFIFKVGYSFGTGRLPSSLQSFYDGCCDRGGRGT
jgi:hypothetical protein